MSFFTSIDFLACICCLLAGWIARGWLDKRRNAAAMRSRQPRYLQVPFVGHGGRQVETITCDRRHL